MEKYSYKYLLKEQPEDSRRKFVKGDNIVTWKKEMALYAERYYHVYEKGKLNNEINKHIKLGLIEDKYEVGNWILIINKRNNIIIFIIILW